MFTINTDKNWRVHVRDVMADKQQTHEVRFWAMIVQDAGRGQMGIIIVPFYLAHDGTIQAAMNCKLSYDATRSAEFGG